MESIPSFLVVISTDFSEGPKVELKRHLGGQKGRKHQEADFDQLIINQLRIIESCFKQAGVIDPDSKLKYLGRQLDQVDVLLAEVEEQGDAFRRLVLVEDKLLKNPESRKHVLAQLLDYAVRYTDFDADWLAEKVDPSQHEWLKENHSAVNASFTNGDFLLVMAGDQIHDRSLKLAATVIDRTAGHLRAFEFCALVLALYELGDDYVFVPHVVGKVTTGERDLVVRLESASKDHKLEVVESETATTGGRRRKAKVNEVLSKLTPKQSAIAQRLFDEARGLGAELLPGASSVSVRLPSPVGDGRHLTLFVLSEYGTIFIGWHDYWDKYTKCGPAVADQFEKRMIRLLGKLITSSSKNGTNIEKVDGKVVDFVEIVRDAVAGMQGKK